VITASAAWDAHQDRQLRLAQGVTPHIRASPLHRFEQVWHRDKFAELLTSAAAYCN
jgi:hypothetical protein